MVLAAFFCDGIDRIHACTPQTARDEADNKLIEAAVAATAIIITYNVRDFVHADLAKHGWDVMIPNEFNSLFDLEF